MKYLLLFLLSFNVYANFTDVKFGQSQIADSQWNVSACMYTTTCQIYSKAVGTTYKIPWTSGQLSWSAGDYVKFEVNIVQTGSYCNWWSVFGVCLGGYTYTYGQSATNPWLAKQYNANGTLKATMGAGHVINMGADYFFFVGSDNNTGALFSPTIGMNSSAGVTWTGTLNPTVAQLNTASANWTTTPLTAGQTYTPAPSLCCGGSSVSFNPDSAQMSRVQNFLNRTTGDSKVYIEQLGNDNTIEVNQTGTPNNYTNYYSNGSYNNVSVTQSSTSLAASNYLEVSILGNSNDVTSTQQSTGGNKSAFVAISDSNNTVTLQQKDSGSHYADIILSGGNKNVDVLQQGSGSHRADISLTGNTTSLSLSQSGSTSQYYSINFNCAIVGGCQAIQVQQ